MRRHLGWQGMVGAGAALMLLGLLGAAAGAEPQLPERASERAVQRVGVQPADEPSAVAPASATPSTDPEPAPAATTAVVAAASGRPDDGSVGNADDKDPAGQTDSDANKGYECDENLGVGQGNPAHSDECGSTTTTTTSTTTTTVAVTSTTVAATSTIGPTTPSHVDSRPAEVLGVVLTAPSADAAPAARGPLARTGVSPLAPAAAGVVLIGFGLGLASVARTGRRRRAST